MLRGSLYHAYGDKQVDLGAGAGSRQQRRATPRGCLTTKIATDETAMDERVRNALRDRLQGLAQVFQARLPAPDAVARLCLPPDEAARLLVTFRRAMW